jgi:hypothetical protein
MLKIIGKFKSATCLVGLVLLVITSPAAAGEGNPKVDCDSGWRSITKNVMSGEGQASISAQCRSDEKPCPPRHELVRRAKLVANAYAVANIQAKVRSEVSHEVVVENGVGSDRLKIKVEGEVFQVKFCHREDENLTFSKAYGEAG